MRFNDIVSISGMSGLYKMENQKVNGIIVTSLAEGWTKFISSRAHLFSLLENISIYTDTDNVNLLDVMIAAHGQKETNPPVDVKASDDELKAYFAKVLPSYEKEKVHASDIRKFIKWFLILDEKGIIQTEIEELAKAAAAEKEESKEDKEDKEDIKADA